jgi:hypothetical protein
MSNQSTILFTAYVNGEPKQYLARGRVAQTLHCLVAAGSEGITALEVNSWAFRLASYIYDLRHDYELDIQTKPELHEGGSHARYFLITPVEVMEVGGGSK